MHNYTVKINGVSVSPSRLKLNEEFSQASTGDMLIIYKSYESFNIEEYHMVEIFEDGIIDDDTGFRGIIMKVKQAPRSSVDDNYNITVEFIDNSYYANILFTRIAFNDQTIDEAITTIVTERIQNEYPFIIIDDIDVYTLKVKKLTANFEKTAATMQKIADRSASYWQITNDYNFRFKLKSSLPNIGLIDLDDVDTESFEKKVNRLRTRQYLKGGLAETDEQTREFKGDGTNQVFTVDFPIAKKPQLFISAALPAGPADEVDPDVIGVRGIDDTNPLIEWLFSFNSTEISQMITEVPLTTAQFLTPKFIGLFEIAQVTNDTSQQAAIAAKIGGSGVIEALDVDLTIRSIDDAESKNTSLLADFSNPEFKLPLKSKRDIMNVGDLFAYPKFTGLEFLCQKKTTILKDCELTDITYTAFEGSYYGGWVKYFSLKADTADFVISDNEKITFVENVNEQTNWTEDVAGGLEVGNFAKSSADPYTTIGLSVVTGSAIPIYSKG